MPAIPAIQKMQNKKTSSDTIKDPKIPKVWYKFSNMRLWQKFVFYVIFSLKYIKDADNLTYFSFIDQSG